MLRDPRADALVGNFASQWLHLRKLEGFTPDGRLYPDFSWANLKGADSNAIPRLKGRFLWSQFIAAKRVGCEMIYVAMFDEVDEGTAIFKCSDNPPVAKGAQFIDYEGLPSDYYLRLTGAGARLLRGQLPPSERPPIEKR